MFSSEGQPEVQPEMSGKAPRVPPPKEPGKPKQPKTPKKPDDDPKPHDPAEDPPWQ